MTKTETERLAAMANSLRPDWPVRSLLTYLATHQTKAYRDVAVALAWIAADPTTQTPARLNENGPWWKATQAAEPTFTHVTVMCPDHPTEPAGRCRPCEQAAITRDEYHTKMQALQKARR